MAMVATVSESLRFDVVTTEDGAGWTAFLPSLVARGLTGVSLVVSDDHRGLKAAVAAVLTGATWQRCRTHFAREPRADHEERSGD